MRARTRWMGMVLALGLGAAASAPAQRPLSDRRAVNPDASVRIFNLIGSVRLEGWDRDTVAVSGTVGKRGGQFYFGAGGPGAKMGVELPQDVKSPDPSHLEVHVPRRARVWIKTESATIEVAGVEGGLDLYSVGGTIQVRGTPREVYAESIDGAIEIAGTTRWTRAKTAAAPITLRGVRGDVAATTVGGRLDVSGGPFERVRLESVTGDIRFDGDLDRGGSYDFESHSGAIDLVFPATVDAEFDIEAFQGSIENGLTHAAPRPRSWASGGPSRGDGRGAILSMSTGRGGAQVEVRVFKGTVRLSRR